jgi:hypothetical protein
VTDPKKPALAPRDATRVKSVGTRRLPSDAFAHLPQPTIGPAMPGSIPMPRGHATELKPRNAQFLENILRAAHEFGPTGAMAQAFGAGQDARSAVRERSPLKAVGALASLGLAAIPEARGAGKVAGKVAGEALDALPTNPFHDLPEPPRVFHGTNAAFDEFDPAKVRAQWGYWFSEAPEVANAYAAVDRAGAPNVRPARIALRNPVDPDAALADGDGQRLAAAAVAGMDEAERHEFAASVRAALAGQYHGVPRWPAANYGEAFDRVAWVLSEDDARAAFRGIGFDGMARGEHGARALIPFGREQIRSPWGDWQNAAQFGALAGVTAGAAAVGSHKKREQSQ